MRKRFLTGLFVAAIASAGMASAANAATTFTATDGTAKADLTLVGTSLTVVLTNLTTAANTTGAINLLTGFELLPSPPGLTGMTISNQTAAKEFNFNAGSTTTGTIDSTGGFNPNWVITAGANGHLYFNGFGAGGVPIIGGPAAGGTTYANGGSSLASGPHGTDIYLTATFTLTTTPGFSLTSVTGANFLFNTDGSSVHGSNPPPPPPPVPVPAAAWTGLTALAGLGAVGKLRKKLHQI